MIYNIVNKLRAIARKKRKEIFTNEFTINNDTKILDLGANDGSYIDFILQGSDYEPSNVYIADINKEGLDEAAEKFGFNAILIPESGSLPFDDEYFDIIFCSSVIEHVTANKEDIKNEMNSKIFTSIARVRQKEFSEEIKRLGKYYFVQTPNKYFFIESHSWLPLISYLPRVAQVRILKISNLFWLKKTTPDWLLLSVRDMTNLFPEARIVREKWIFFTKSIMAIKS